MQIFHLRGNFSIHIRGYLTGKHTVKHVLIDALLEIFCIGLKAAKLLVHLHHLLPGFTFEPVDLVGHTDFLALVVSLAHGVLHFLIPAFERGGQTLKGLALLLHGAGVHLLHVGLDDLHGLGACDVAVRNHFVGTALAYTLGAGQRADRVDTAILQDVQILERGLVARAHAAERGGHIGHIRRRHAERRARVANRGQRGEHLFCRVAVGLERLAHGRQVVVQERRGVGHSFQLAQILLRCVLRAEQRRE